MSLNCPCLVSVCSMLCSGKNVRPPRACQALGIGIISHTINTRCSGKVVDMFFTGKDMTQTSTMQRLDEETPTLLKSVNLLQLEWHAQLIAYLVGQVARSIGSGK